uniref:CSON004584 protein n=1 Tax=Culicoides sonorensis TaxID=179676 RepID=A0A336LXM2_CULSO
MNTNVQAVVFAASFLLLNEEESEETPARTKWVADWVKKRKEFGCYQNLMAELRLESPILFKNFIRMSGETFDLLEQLVSPIISKKITPMREPISAGERLALTLRYLATGESFSSLQYIFRIPQSTISSIIPEVCDAIYQVLKDEYLKCATTENEWISIANKFYEQWNFPNCLGAIDGKHVEIIAPPNSGSLYFNYKKTNSIVLLGICDADYLLTYIDVGVNGRHSDGGVFKNCTFYKAMIENNQVNIPPSRPLPGRVLPVPYVLVGDDAFAVQKHLLKPFALRNLTGTQRVFNYRLSRARRIIENVFGIMSAVFRVLRAPILLGPEKACKITKTCAVLHNFLMKRNRNVYAPSGTFDRCLEDGSIVSGSWRSDVTNSSFYGLERSDSFDSKNAKAVREEFENFFVGEGEVSFQYAQI